MYIYDNMNKYEMNMYEHDEYVVWGWVWTWEMTCEDEHVRMSMRIRHAHIQYEYEYEYEYKHDTYNKIYLIYLMLHFFDS